MGHLISTSFPLSVIPSGEPPSHGCFGCGSRPISCTTSLCLSSYRMRASSSYLLPCSVAAFPVKGFPLPHFLRRRSNGFSYLFSPMAVAQSLACEHVFSQVEPFLRPLLRISLFNEPRDVWVHLSVYYNLLFKRLIL
jgi:hypothetical protein